MRTLVHLSDLHFGTVRQEIVLPVLSLIERIQPDVVAVSGDLTQRARKEQFVAAREFLDAVRFPKIVVPGNHDIPLYNLFARFVLSLLDIGAISAMSLNHSIAILRSRFWASIPRVRQLSKAAGSIPNRFGICESGLARSPG
jgi:metallophosphoesterase superfamily enzyme